MKISKIQINILNYLNNKRYLYYQYGVFGVFSWIDMGGEPRIFIHRNTYKSLLNNALIQFISSDVKNFSRRKYTISEKGINFLKEL